MPQHIPKAGYETLSIGGKLKAYEGASSRQAGSPPDWSSEEGPGRE